MENNAFLSSFPSGTSQAFGKAQDHNLGSPLTYEKFAAELAALPFSSLVASFNSQVGNRGWSSARAAHNRALIDELIRRGIDVSAVFDGLRTSFAHHVELDDVSSKLVVLD